jgi:CRISPR/Cas system endoribonuclease Cas6 (RAMP superfamily)
MQLRRIIGYLQKLLYTVKRIRMSPTPTLNIYLFEGPIVSVQKSEKISAAMTLVEQFLTELRLKYKQIMNKKLNQLYSTLF